MTALYLIAQEYRSAAAALADLDMPPEAVADTLEGMSGELEVKAQAVGHMVRGLEASALAMKAWAKESTDRAKAVEARADHLRRYLADNLQACGISKVEGPGIALSFRKSTAVVIDSADMIPAEFMAQPDPPPPSPSKTLIGDALKAGRNVPGARLEHRTNLQIK